MYTLEKIDKELVNCDFPNLSSDFVAAAVQLNDKGIAYHAGIVICLEEDFYLFHFTGSVIAIKEVPNGQLFFHKKINGISEKLVLAFFNHCRVVAKEANPKYGIFYDGSYYDVNGKFSSPNNIPEIMTCVGFCLNVIVGFLDSEEYIVTSDWISKNNAKVDAYFEEFIAEFIVSNPKVDIALIRANLRRIKPSQYLASAYVEEIPVKKSDIDGFIEVLEGVLLSKKRLPASKTVN